ncbi:MAG: AtpZ/AtpI family protein [Planctomycetes bacterium]|nr:AtpZ/AtpI family protein [Planctomycetota bacterium]
MNDLSRGDQELGERVEGYRRREARARTESVGSVWRTVGRVGALGWLIAIPTVLGIWVGHALDRAWGTGVTWALALLLCGVGVGVSFLWFTLREVGDELKEEEP